ncbi:hypothetical protein M434DRAFT_211995 [Hypoxylon sp. CO27-5]|nr:hypothetical protein M434DRAFT_211995 [Hypoxylon sp. CO27-5]
MATVETVITELMRLAAKETALGPNTHSHSSGGNSKAVSQTNHSSGDCKEKATVETVVMALMRLAAKETARGPDTHSHSSGDNSRAASQTNRIVNAERPPKNPRQEPSVPPNGQSPRDSHNGSPSGNGSGNGGRDNAGRGGGGGDVSAPSRPTSSRPRTMGERREAIWWCCKCHFGPSTVAMTPSCGGCNNHEQCPSCKVASWYLGNYDKRKYVWDWDFNR